MSIGRLVPVPIAARLRALRTGVARKGRHVAGADEANADTARTIEVRWTEFDALLRGFGPRPVHRDTFPARLRSHSDATAIAA